MMVRGRRVGVWKREAFSRLLPRLLYPGTTAATRLVQIKHHIIRSEITCWRTESESPIEWCQAVRRNLTVFFVVRTREHRRLALKIKLQLIAVDLSWTVPLPLTVPSPGVLQSSRSIERPAQCRSLDPVPRIVLGSQRV